MHKLVNGQMEQIAGNAPNAPSFPFVAPNYSAQEGINRISTNNGTWTVDRNGYVLVSIMANVVGSALCSINGKWVGQAYSGTSAGAQAFMRNVYPVKVGDVVKLWADAGTPEHIFCYYIPPVFVNR
jgi:hypothetical protein